MSPFAYAETATPVSPSPSPSPSSSSAPSGKPGRSTKIITEPRATPSTTATSAPERTSKAPASAAPTEDADPAKSAGPAKSDAATESSKPTATEAPDPTPAESATAPATPEPTGPQPTGTAPTPESTDSLVPRAAIAAPSGTSVTATVTATASVEPFYGAPKVRVGVKIADDAFVPEDVSTWGSTFSIVARDAEGAVRDEYTCTTGPQVDAEPALCATEYFGSAGESFTVRQIEAAPGLVLDPTSQSVGPCVVPEQGDICGGGFQELIFTNDVVSPTATEDQAGVETTGSVDVDVLANDETQGAPILSLEVTEPAANGTTDVTAENLIRYTPNSGFLGVDTFGYQYETVNGTANATVTVTVTEGEPPTATDDEATLNNYLVETVDIDVLANDDTQGAPILSLEATTVPAHGYVEVIGVGADAFLRYYVFPLYEGPDSFDYTYETANGSATGTVNLTVTLEPEAPTAGDDTVTVANDSSVDVSVLDNDDPQGEALASMAVTQPATHGVAEVVPEEPAPRFIRYTPEAGFVGTDTFGYTYETVNGSASGTVTVTVTEGGPPTPNYGVAKLRVGVRIADGDFVPEGTHTNGSTLRIVRTGLEGEPKADFTCITDTPPDEDREYTYCPDYYQGEQGDTFTITQLTAAPGLVLNPEPKIFGPCEAVIAPFCAGVRQEVTLINDVVGPTASNDAATIEDTASVDVDVLGNDGTQGAPILALEVTDAALHGTTEVTAENLIRYTPNAGFSGDDTFGYTYETANGTASGTVTVTVIPAAEPPTATDDETTVDKTSSVDVDVLANDDTQGAPVLTLEVDKPASHGNAEVVAGELAQVIRYTPDGDYVGTDTFGYTYETGTGTATATVTVTITEAGPPTATDDSAMVDNLGLVFVDVLANDNTQGVPVLTMAVTSAPQHGGVSWSPDNPEQPILYDPMDGFVGTDTFGYTYTTAYGEATGVVTVEVTGVEIPPGPNYGLQKVRVGVQIADGAYVPEGTNTGGTTLQLVLTSANPAIDPVVTECTTDAAQPGTSASYCPGTVTLFPGYQLKVTQTTVQPGLALNPNPVVIPPCINPVLLVAAIAAVPTCEEKTAIIIDGGLPPTATDDRDSVDNRAQTDVAVLTNDHTQGAPVLSLAVSRAPGHGTAQVNGNQADGLVRYTPAAGYVGRDTFDYTYRTANGSATATVTIKVSGTSPASAVPSPTQPADNDASDLADTGSSDGAGVGLGLGLLLSSAGAALIASRRKTGGRHV